MRVGGKKTGRAVVTGRAIGAVLTAAGAFCLFRNATLGIINHQDSGSEGVDLPLMAISTAFLAFAVAIVRTAYAAFPSEIDRLRRGAFFATAAFIGVVLGLWIASNQLSSAEPLTLYAWIREAYEWVLAAPLALTGFLLTLAGMVAPDAFLYGDPKKKKEHEELKRRRRTRTLARKRLLSIAPPSTIASPSETVPESKQPVKWQGAWTPQRRSASDSLMTIAGLGFLLIGIWALQKLPEPKGRHEV